MRKSVLCLLIILWAAVLYSFSPLIYKDIIYKDLDAASALLVMLYGVNVFFSSAIRIGKFPLMLHLISYIFISLIYFYIIVFYRTSNDIPVVLLMYFITTGAFVFVICYEKNRQNKLVKNIDK